MAKDNEKKRGKSRCRVVETLKIFRFWLAGKKSLTEESEIGIQPYDTVSAKEVDAAIDRWKNETRTRMYGLTKKYKNHRLSGLQRIKPSTAYNISYPQVEKILPTLQEICDAIDEVLFQCKRTISCCVKYSDLDKLMTRLDAEQASMNEEVSARIEMFEAYVSRSDRCFQFVGEMRRMMEAFQGFKKLSPINKSTCENSRLESIIGSLIRDWEDFCSDKSVVRLDAFFNRIAANKRTIAFMWNETFPKTEDGAVVDVRSYTIGFEAGRQSVVLPTTASLSIVSKKRGNKNRRG